MCLNPLKIINKSKRLYYKNNIKLINYVPCGKCAECKIQYTNDIMIRTYYECLSANYVVFDTLTYNEKNVPKLNKILKNDYHIDIYDEYDYNVLYYIDVQKFLKRLRKNIKIKCSYLIAGEYGSENNRPHYHLLLFVKDDTPVEKIKDFIYQNWHNGFTDGSGMTLSDYIDKRVFSKFKARYNAIAYVCKYMNKIGYFDNILYNYIYKKYKVSCENNNNIFDNKSVQCIYKNFKQFVKWSHNYGNEKFDIDEYEINGYIQVDTEWKHNKYTLPLYYLRKYYKNRVNENYIDNQRKMNYDKLILNKKKLQILSKFIDIINNSKDEYIKSISRKVLKNLVEYKLCKQYRIKNNDYIYSEEYLNVDENIIDCKNDKITFEQFIKKYMITVPEYDFMLDKIMLENNKQRKLIKESKINILNIKNNYIRETC